ncbi:EamA-like transporter family protein [Desulfosporosinus acididurans]|uniref:EamA-like transporter family protein n=1 Tax=Desulfosporosinus acididurans TaxID=476652 RepID=A0A0J1FX95_9FIRM|nr:DMT family transporter [Desulfosporosinus acididurans]KLU67932.1 EamA-like transporter family protein [Desulfosporosinus acididurans]
MLKFLSLPFVIAGISGITMAVQGTLNSLLSEKTSLLSATFIVHIIGTVIALLALLVCKIPIYKHNWGSIPWFLYLGGLLSVLIVGLVAVSIPKIGVCNATTAIIIGQVSTAVLIDHFGWFGIQRFPWNPWQFLGIVLFAAGAKLLFR